MDQRRRYGGGVLADGSTMLTDGLGWPVQVHYMDEQSDAESDMGGILFFVFAGLFIVGFITTLVCTCAWHCMKEKRAAAKAGDVELGKAGNGGVAGGGGGD